MKNERKMMKIHEKSSKFMKNERKMMKIHEKSKKNGENP